MEKISNFRERVSSVSHVEMPRKDIWKSLVAEFLGTFILVLVGVGCGLYINESEKLNLVGIALCWGLIIATLAQSLGHISGCHINPAVTVAMLITRKIELVKAVLYVAVQCLGAVAGVFVLKVLTPESTKGGYGVVNVHSELSSLQGFVVEFIITFILLFIVFAVSDEGRNDIKGSIPLALGLTVTAIILCAGHLTGAGLNPARVFGPAVVMNSWKNHWVWWLGEIGGAVTAAAVYEHVLRNPRPDEIEAAEIAKSNRRSDTEMKENGLTPPV